MPNRKTRTYGHRPAGGAQTTIAIRLELEAIADQLHDESLALAEEFHRLEALAAAAREEWRLADLRRAAAEQALRDLPDIVPDAETPAAAQAA